jgi:hypothetical protein
MSITRPNLTAVLALAALADLLLGRLASLVFLPSHAARGAALFLTRFGLFMSNLGGILGVVLVAVVLLRSLRGDTIFPRSMRITVSAIGFFFVMLATAGVLTLPVPERFTAYLRISHAFLAGFVAAGMWHRRCPVRLKMVLTLFAAPIVLQAGTMFFERMGWSPRLVIQGGRMAQASAFSALLLSPLLVIPGRRRGLQVAAMLAAGVAALVLMALVMVRYFGLAQVIALYGLRFDLPGLADGMGKSYAAMAALAYVSVTVATAASLAGDATSRLVGYGLVLLATAGHQVVAPNHTLFSLCGLCAIAIAAVRLESAAHSSPTPNPSGTDRARSPN